MSSILITGGAGFIGAHLLEYLLEHTTHTVTILDRLDSEYTCLRLKYLLEKYPKLRFVLWDLKEKIPSDLVYGIDKVVHLAASSHVDSSIKDPLLFTMDNVVGTCNLLDWMKGQIGIKLIHVSTDEIFGSATEGKIFKENDMAHPENPYAATKVGAEALVRAYACTYELTAMIVRFTNVIGIRQHPEKFIPKVISRVLKDEQIPIHTDSTGNKDGSRYYLKIEDAISGLVKLMRHFNKLPILSKEDRWDGIYHISGRQEITNSKVVHTISSFIGKTPDIKRVSYSADRPYHDLCYRIDDTRMKNLGWETTGDIVSYIEEITAWSLENPEWLALGIK